MNADAIIQNLAIKIYEAPLSGVRNIDGYPNLLNPLHLAVLLIDCDTEISMNGILGYLENSSGRHLDKTIDALTAIEAFESAKRFGSVRSIMGKHNVTWEKLREDFSGVSEFEITSFSKLHGRDAFSREIIESAGEISLFYTDQNEDVYPKLCSYLDNRIDQLIYEIENQK